MVAANNVRSIDALIDKPIISRANGNKLGRVHDLLVDPIKGVVLGLSTQLLDGSTSVTNYGEIYSVGPDAVMVNNDDSVKFVSGGVNTQPDDDRTRRLNDVFQL